jgi:hypothetical protein
MQRWSGPLRQFRGWSLNKRCLKKKHFRISHSTRPLASRTVAAVCREPGMRPRRSTHLCPRRPFYRPLEWPTGPVVRKAFAIVCSFRPSDESASTLPVGKRWTQDSGVEIRRNVGIFVDYDAVEAQSAQGIRIVGAYSLILEPFQRSTLNSDSFGSSLTKGGSNFSDIPRRRLLTGCRSAR